MCAAGEVALVQTMHGAGICASTAAGTQRVVNGRQVVDHLDRAVGTGLFALHTANTAVCAVLARNGALVVIGALHNHSRGVGD